MESIDNRGGPFPTRRIALKQSEKTEALHPPSVEACWRRARLLKARK